MAGYGARERDGRDTHERSGLSGPKAAREHWEPMARIERGADGRVRIRLSVGAAGRRDGSGGDAPPRRGG